MHILLTGGTGLIGKHLCQYWLGQGHRLTVWSRRPEQVAKICGSGVRGIARLEQLEADDHLDAVVNLAGAPIADRPWTAARRNVLWASRVTLTEQLLAWLGTREQRPEVLISGSAVGWYGDGGERELTEASPRCVKISPASCVLPGKRPPSVRKRREYAWYWSVPAWCWPAMAAFCRACACPSNWGWAGLWAMGGNGCPGFI